jgi:hypothetical protein
VTPTPRSELSETAAAPACSRPSIVGRWRELRVNPVQLQPLDSCGVRLAVGVVVVCCALTLGCGGHRSSGRTDGSGGVQQTSQAEQRRAHEADNLAYLEIARASGTLRANAAATALGRAPRIANLPAIAAAAKTLLQVQPRDSGLITTRGRMRAALAAALAARGDRRSQRAAAIEALKATDAINRQLETYAARHPDVQALVPD